MRNRVSFVEERVLISENGKRSSGWRGGRGSSVNKSADALPKFPIATLTMRLTLWSILKEETDIFNQERIKSQHLPSCFDTFSFRISLYQKLHTKQKLFFYYRSTPCPKEGRSAKFALQTNFIWCKNEWKNPPTIRRHFCAELKPIAVSKCQFISNANGSIFPIIFHVYFLKTANWHFRACHKYGPWEFFIVAFPIVWASL